MVELKGRILVLEDEESIREILQCMFEDRGYEAVTTAKGEDTIEQYRDNGPFDLVSMDLTIAGGLGGVETMAALKEFDPDIKAIILSAGYRDDDVIRNYQDYGFNL